MECALNSVSLHRLTCNHNCVCHLKLPAELCTNKELPRWRVVLRLPFLDCTAALLNTVYSLCSYLSSGSVNADIANASVQAEPPGSSDTCAVVFSADAHL